MRALMESVPNFSEGRDSATLDAIRRARERRLEVLGFYHSHPHSAAAPSAADREEASYPDHLYLIVGLAHEPPEMRCFRLKDGNFLELAFVTSD